MKRLVYACVLLIAICVAAVPVFPQPVPTTNLVVLSGQQTATSTAVNLGANPVKTICVKALAGNSGTLYLGGSAVTTGTGMEMSAGNSWCANLTNTNTVYIIASVASQSVSWVATK